MGAMQALGTCERTPHICELLVNIWNCPDNSPTSHNGNSRKFILWGQMGLLQARLPATSTTVMRQ